MKYVCLQIGLLKKYARTEVELRQTQMRARINKKRVIFKTFAATGCRKLSDERKLNKLKGRSGRVRNYSGASTKKG